MKLTARELEMLAFASEGLSNSAIATKHETSPQVVKNRWQVIYEKLGLNNRTVAVAHAIRKGLI